MTRAGSPLRVRRQPDGRPDDRFEYRVWCRRPHPAGSILQRAWQLTGAERRTDIYLLTEDSDRVLVKLRHGGRLKIKRRRACSPPLQRWRRRPSRRFPLTSSERTALAGALRAARGLSSVAALSPAHLLAELGPASAPVVAQPVRKSRLLFRSAGCRAELCRVAVGGWTGLTVALEAREPAAIAAAVGALSLDALPNRSYGEALLRLAHPHPDWRRAPDRVDAIDWRPR